MMYVALYLALAVIVGLFALGRKGGFLLYFILSLVLTPVISLVILLIATPVVVDTEGRRLPRR